MDRGEGDGRERGERALCIMLYEYVRVDIVNSMYVFTYIWYLHTGIQGYRYRHVQY